MHMVFADDAREHADVFGVTDVDQQRSTALLNVALQHVIALFGDPDHMHGQARDGVATMAISLHLWWPPGRQQSYQSVWRRV